MQEDELLVLLKQKPRVAQLCKLDETCSICETNSQAKYRCPRCKIVYCRLECYKKHNTNCVDKFSEEVEKDKMRGPKAGLDEQIKMKKALGRMYREMKDEPIVVMRSEEEERRLEQLCELAERGELEIESLSFREQHEFGQYIESMVLDEWKAWWEDDEGVFSLYVEESDVSRVGDTFRSKLRWRIKLIPEFGKLNKRNPSADIRNHLFNIVASMVLVSRSTNGEVVGGLVREVCMVLGKQAMEIGSVSNGYYDLCERAMRVDKWLFEPQLSRVLGDCLKVFSNKFYVIEILFYGYEIDKNKMIYFISYGLSRDHGFYEQMRRDILELIKLSSQQN